MSKRKPKANQEIIPDLKVLFAPANDEQTNMIKCISENTISFCTGPAGCGKTFVSMAFAITELLQGHYERIILSRAAIAAAGEQIGYLRGSIQEKTEPFFSPLLSVASRLVGYETLETLLSKNGHEPRIIIVPFSFMRGHSWQNSIIVLDEGQSATIEQMHLFLTRIATGSKMIVVGDLTQSDLSCRNGLEDAIELLQGVEDIGFVELSEESIVRHRIIKDIEQRYRKRAQERQDARRKSR